MAKEVRIGLTGETRVTKDQSMRDGLGIILAAMFEDKTLEEVARLLTNDMDSALEYWKLQLGVADGGQRMSLLFNPHRLDTKTITSEMSLYQALTGPGREHFCNALARACVVQADRTRRMADPMLFYRAIQMNVNGIQYVNEFPPHVSRDILRKYGMHKGSKILDPCAGWGGRMIGTSIVSDLYVGYDPFTTTALGLQRLAKTLSGYSPGFKAAIRCKPFEDSNLPDDFFDLAITSPPYYDTEEYTDEETNSLNRYKTFDEWAERFFLVMIFKTMEALKPGGVFILNIGSRKYPLARIMKDFCKDHYRVQRLGNSYISNKSGLGKGKAGDEGESFYALFKG